MSQRTIVMLTDDLDGTAIADGKGETVRFGLDGSSYEIDLADKNAKAMRELMGKYVEKGRRTSSGSSAGRGRGGRSSTGSSNQRDYDPKEVRAWAQQHDLKVPERGRIPATVLVQFKEATGS